MANLPKPKIILAIVCSLFALAQGQAATDKTTNERDNSKVNKRDRSVTEVTADQQSNKPADVEITRRIRQDIMKIKNLSVYGQNIKIITIDGHVTLKGPVRSAQEKAVIVEKARSIAGMSKVDDRIEVQTN